MDGQFGFLYADYVELTGEKVTLGSDGRPVLPEEPKPETGKGITTGNVNFREGPGTSYPSFGTLKKIWNLRCTRLQMGGIGYRSANGQAM